MPDKQTTSTATAHPGMWPNSPDDEDHIPRNGESPTAPGVVR